MGSILDELLGEKERAAEVVPIITKADVARRLRRAEEAVAAARRAAVLGLRKDDDGLAVAEAELADARDAARPHTRIFRFEAVAPDAVDALRVAHQPTKEQSKEWRDAQAKRGVLPKDMTALPWNTDTYLPALCALCCVDPVMSEEDWSALFSSGVYSEGELTDLANAAQACNIRGGRVDLGEA